MLVEIHGEEIANLIAERSKYIIENKIELKPTEIPTQETLSKLTPMKLTWRKYKNKVKTLTEAQDLSCLPNYHLRGFNNYHLDHRTSVYQAFRMNWSPEKTAHINNLQMIPREANLKKGRRSTPQEIPLIHLLATSLKLS